MFFYSISFIIHRKPTLLLLSWSISWLQIMVLLLVGKNVGSLSILIVDMNNKLTLITLTFTVRWEYYDMWQCIYTFSSCYRGHEIVIIYVCKMCCRHNTFRILYTGGCHSLSRFVVPATLHTISVNAHFTIFL